MKCFDEKFTALLALLLIMSMFVGHSLSIDYQELEKDLAIETASLEEQTDKVIRYEAIISDMMQGQWEPGMGIQKAFHGDFYGTLIWTFKAVNRPPGSPKVDVGEILDRKIQGE